MFRIGQNAVGVDGSIYNSGFSLKRLESIIFMITGCNRRPPNFCSAQKEYARPLTIPGLLSGLVGHTYLSISH
jgi:hypothetical protein